MAFHKRKKITRMRGTRTHGWGRLHRGSGNKGGAGNAGSGKKADAKKPSFWNRKFGKNGFIAHNAAVDHCIINVGDLAQHLDTWVAAKQATHSGGIYAVDLGKLGYTKLLGAGKVSNKVNVTVAAVSKKAAEKVEAAGGSVTASA